MNGFMLCPKEVTRAKASMSNPAAIHVFTYSKQVQSVGHLYVCRGASLLRVVQNGCAVELRHVFACVGEDVWDDTHTFLRRR